MKAQLNEVEKLQKIAGILKESLNKPAQKLMGLDLVKSELGDTVNANTLAKFLYNNFKKVTGRKQSERHSEEDFPQEFYDAMDYYNIDFNEFQNGWNLNVDGLGWLIK